jgi:hypothetical protein
MRTLTVLIALATSACATASAPSYEQAVTLHNVLREAVVDVDHAFLPVYQQELAKADAANQSDDAAFNKAIAPYKAAAEALTGAKKIEQALHLVIAQWSATGSGPLAETLACAADALTVLAVAMEKLPSAKIADAAVIAASTELHAMAQDAACTVSK